MDAALRKRSSALMPVAMSGAALAAMLPVWWFPW